MMRKPFIDFLLAGLVAATIFLFSFPPCLWAIDRNVHVISSDDSGLTVELNIPQPDLKEITLSDGVFDRVGLNGWATTLIPGFPELPLKGMVIQVPPSGRITVEMGENFSSVLPNLFLSPVPTLKLSDKGVLLKEYKADQSAYGAQEFLPNNIVEIERIGIIRGVHMARVMFHPFQWNPATRELRCYTKITAKVLFEDPLSSQSGASSVSVDSSSRDDFSVALKEAITNYRPSVHHRVDAGRFGERESFASAVAVNPVKISIKRDGIYRITGKDLRKKGVNIARIHPATLKLHNRGDEIAIRVVTKGKRFTSRDYIEFYGKGVDSTFTDTNVYWLSWGGDNGKRMAALDGTVTGQGVRPAFFVSTIRFEENHVAWGLTPDAPDKDYWFWEKIDAPSTKDHVFTLSSVSNSSENGTVRVCFRGRTTASPHPNHHTKIILNGTVIGDTTWDGNGEYIQEMAVPLSVLKEGTNSLIVESRGDTGAVVDTVYLNWFEVSYLRGFHAMGDELKFPVVDNGRFDVTVDNLTQPTVNIYDITDPLHVAIFSNCSVKAGGNGYEATVEDVVTGQKTFFAVADDAIQKPSSLEVWRSSKLKSDTNKADYILITAREFLCSLSPLIHFRHAQGLEVKAVAIEDIYNEFSYGLTDPQAIKDFLRYAYEKWQRPAPVYVLLVGDGTYDYRDYLGTGKKSVVPVHLSVTPFLGITPDDNWYVAVEGDDVLPEMIIGRIPASSKVMAVQMARKILNYEMGEGYMPQEALFAADNNDPYFEAIDENMITRLSAGVTPRRVYLGSYANVKTAKQDLIDNINRGMMLTTYVGHGDVTHWAGEGLLESADILGLKNRKKLTFVVALDCLNGWFADPSYYSIGETFVTARRSGAIASFSPSGLAYSSEHDILGNAVFSSIFEKGNRQLGVITTGSKIEAFAQGVSENTVKIFTLLGDPAVRLRGGE